MHQEIALLYDYLAIGALLFGVGLVGFLSRRNMIVMFLSAEMMLQGVSLSLVAWSRFHNDFGGQMLVIFIIAVAACEAAIALAMIVMLFQRSGKLDIAAWQDLREANQPAFVDEELPPQPGQPPPVLPHLTPAGVTPEISQRTTQAPSRCLKSDTLLTLSIPGPAAGSHAADGRAGQARASAGRATGRRSWPSPPPARPACCLVFAVERAAQPAGEQDATKSSVGVASKEVYPLWTWTAWRMPIAWTGLD